MSIKREITIYQRESELISLIEDSKKLNFEPQLIRRYESQLTEIQAELQDLKNRKKRAIEFDKVRQNRLKQEIPNVMKGGFN